MIVRSSRPMRPGSARPSGAPASSSARARSIWKRHEARASASPVSPCAICASRHAEARDLVLRQVDAALAVVDRDVLPEIDELQARADRVRPARVRARRARRKGRAAAGRPGFGRAAAVVEHLGEVRVARLDVTSWRKRGEQIVEQRRAAGRCSRMTSPRARANQAISGRCAALECGSNCWRKPSSCREPHCRRARRLRRRNRRPRARSDRSARPDGADRAGSRTDATGKFS